MQIALWWANVYLNSNIRKRFTSYHCRNVLKDFLCMSQNCLTFYTETIILLITVSNAVFLETSLFCTNYSCLNMVEFLNHCSLFHRNMQTKVTLLKVYSKVTLIQSFCFTSDTFYHVILTNKNFISVRKNVDLLQLPPFLKYLADLPHTKEFMAAAGVQRYPVLPSDAHCFYVMGKWKKVGSENCIIRTEEIKTGSM